MPPTDAEVIARVGKMVNQGYPRLEIEKAILDMGCSMEDMRTIMAGLNNAKAAAHRNAGFKHMLSGGCLCAFGVIVTAYTYWKATTSPTGGVITIAYGAVFAGFMQFLYGTYQATDKAN